MKSKIFTLIHSKNSLHIAPEQYFVPSDALTDLLTLEEAVDRVETDALEYRKEQVKQVELAKELAQKEGFEAGFQAWTEKIAELEEEIANVNKQLYQKLAPVALQAAKKIVGKELEINHKAIVGIVQNALKSVSQHRQILIYVNPQELQTVLEERAGLKELFEHLESLTIRPREDISLGSCVVETEAGIVNVEIENQWKILQQVLERLMTPPEEKS